MKKTIKTGSDFSGVGAFDQALQRLGIEQDKQFSCDMDKYARQTYIYNFGEPKYYPTNVYDREIPKESLDIYMTSPPCQAFSLAGNRKGEADKRGVLFYNSHKFIQKNKPRFFIFENVKGLLSDDSGKTFQRWIDLLGGKTVNGNPVIFPHEDSVPYHVYYQVLNAKHYGIPQNRERIFIIGIRDDEDNDFSFPKPFPLVKRLKDVLENDVDDKYFLSDLAIAKCLRSTANSEMDSKPLDEVSRCLIAGYYKQPFDGQYINTEQETKIGAIRGRNPDNPLSRQSGLETVQMLEINESGTSNALTTVQKDNVVVFTDEKWIIPGMQENAVKRVLTDGGSPCLVSAMGMGGGHTPFHNYGQRIRRLTPFECFRLMDFNESFKWNVSDSQAYKQAGNSICVGVLAKIIERLKL